MATVRYMVHDVDAAVGFDMQRLGFTLRRQEELQVNRFSM